MKQVIAILIVLVSLFTLVSISFADVFVDGYFRRDGTYVRPHWRSDPDRTPYNNWSFPGNRNPYTGRIAPGNLNRYLDRYYNRPPYLFPSW